MSSSAIVTRGYTFSTGLVVTAGYGSSGVIPPVVSTAFTTHRRDHRRHRRYLPITVAPLLILFTLLYYTLLLARKAGF